MLFHRFTFWIVLGSLLCGLEAAMKTYYVEDLCQRKDTAVIYVNDVETGILTSMAPFNPTSCKIRLEPRSGRSTVLSIYSYNLNPEDELIIEDSDNHRIQLLETGFFPHEKKSVLSDGSITIHYSTDALLQNSRVKFQFVFTQTRDGPCTLDEFECRNKRCIKKDIVCDSHNHCGDGSDQQKCGPTTDNKNFKNEVKTKVTVPIAGIVVIVVSSVLVIIIVAIVAVLIRRAVQKKKESQKSLPTTEATVPETPAAPSDAQPRPSYFNQIRRSFRSMMGPKVENTELQQQGSENYQVPSMYPQVPSAPEFPGIDNPDFKVEE